MNILILPILNPLQFYKDVPDVNDQFNSRLFDNWFFADTILDFEQSVCHAMPWQKSDAIQFQLQSNYGPIIWTMHRSSDDAIIDTIAMVQGVPNYNDPSTSIWQINIALAIYPVGEYYFKMTLGISDPLVLRSEKIILSEKSENTLLLSYSHPTFYGDVIFETGFATAIRIDGSLKLKNTSSKDTVFEDQVLNMTMIRSKPYRIWKLFVGVSEGVPDYLHDKLTWILGCRNLQIDGKYYTKSEGAQMEESAEENYPMRGWTIELREKINRGSRIVENDALQDAFIAVMITSDSKAFSGDNGGSETQFIDVI